MYNFNDIEIKYEHRTFFPNINPLLLLKRWHTTRHEKLPLWIMLHAYASDVPYNIILQLSINSKYEQLIYVFSIVFHNRSFF
jgi:hypothetical protein